MRYQAYSQWKRSALSIVLLISFGIILGCSPPAFKSGIRVHTTEALTTSPGASLDVSGVTDVGQLLLARDPHNGSEQAFEGLTGVFGLDDHPNAQTNASWQVSVDYSRVIFECGTGHIVEDVPIGGAIVVATCFL